MLHLNELKKKEEEEEAAMSKVRRKEKTKPWSRNTWNRDRNSTEKKMIKVELVFGKARQDWQTLI